MEFRRLELSDISRLSPYFKYALSRSCDNTAGGIFMWRDFFNTEFAIINDALVFKVTYLNGKTAFAMPLGGDTESALFSIDDYCSKNMIPLIFVTATSAELEVYGKYFEFETVFEPDWSDYIYNASDLSSMSGRRYNGQRNHINAFIRSNPDWSFEEITPQNTAEVLEFFMRPDLIPEKDSPMFSEERKKVIEVLNSLDLYGMFGGLIRTGSEIAAFSLGEISGDTLFIHIEKANHNVRGAYQMIVREFASHFADGSVKFINREEDVGDLGLRKSKLSYHPSDILKKHTVYVTGRR